DDIGMCYASVSALKDLVDFGSISSAATMVPCSWFPEVAAFCKTRPAVDVGVHLTLTSEWEGYRWGPISSRDPATGMMDAEGYFHRREVGAWQHIDPAAAQIEMPTQLARALAAGIDVTHVDIHMSTILHPKLIRGYVKLAVQHRLPSVLLRTFQLADPAFELDRETAAIASQLVVEQEAQGWPMIDSMAMLPLDRSEERIEQAQQVLSNLPPGITHFVIHPSQDTAELRAIAPDWRSRVADYQAFSDEGMKKWIKNSGLHVIGYRAIREVMRSKQAR
ncbi:MAG TPA: polysaccharide deacetylase family protein, partial [Anaerolineae bacterium]